MRRAGALAVAVAALSTARMYAVQGRLPSPVATHFDATGAPNGWMLPPGLVAVHSGLMLLLLVVFVGTPKLMRHLPVGLVHLPNGTHWLAPERRAGTFDRIERWMAALGLLVVLSLAVLQEMVVQANLPGGAGRLSVPALMAVLGTVVSATILWTIGFLRAWRLPAR